MLGDSELCKLIKGGGDRSLSNYLLSVFLGENAIWSFFESGENASVVLAKETV